MAIGTYDFPMLTPQQTSPLGGVLSDAIAKRLALANAQKAEAEAPFAGISSLAGALSKATYANLMGPQFTAKLMENPALRASIPDPQQRLEYILNSVGGGGGGLSGGNVNFNNILQTLKQNNESPGLLDSIRSILGLPPSSSNAPVTSPVSQSVQTAPVAPVNRPVVTTAPAQSVPVQPSHITGWNVSSPQETQDQGLMTVTPTAAPVTTPAASTFPTSVGVTSGRTPENIAFGERTASLKEQEAEREAFGKETGKTKGEAAAEYGKDAETVLSQERAAQNITKLLNDPIIKNIPNLPFANKLTFAVLKQGGTKEQQDKLGQLDAAMNTYANASRGLRGTDADLSFVKSMKPNDSDTLVVRQGKMASLIAYNQAKSEQIRLAHEYVTKYHMDKADAEFTAASDVNMNEIEERAHESVFGKKITSKSSKKDWSHLSDADLARYSNG